MSADAFDYLLIGHHPGTGDGALGEGPRPCGKFEDAELKGHRRRAVADPIKHEKGEGKTA